MAKFKKRMKNTTEKLGTFSTIERGDYLAKVVGSEIKKTKSGDGQLKIFTWEIIKGDSKGIKIFDNVNFDNPSVKAEEIAEKTLVSMCESMGVDPEKYSKKGDTTLLHGKACVVTIDVEEREGYSPKNVIKNIQPVEEGKKKKKKGKGKTPDWAKK